jgi:hypothetical protein
MCLRDATVATLKSKTFLLWLIAGIAIYAMPAAIRFATGRVEISILNFPGFWIDHFIPGNMLEKVLVNAFFPGGVGAVAGEIFFTNYKSVEMKGKTKYLARLSGALLLTGVWSAFQFWGYSLSIAMSYGGNIFESYFVFPINFVLAAFSIFTPDVIHFLKSLIFKKKGYKKEKLVKT